MASTTLRVVPNPFSALDADGMPAGAFPDEDAVGSYIGARLVMGAALPLRTLLSGRTGSPKHRFEFDDAGPVSVPPSAHYVYALRTGCLLPADSATAKECGLKFVPVADALDAAKTVAVATYKAENGRDAGCADAPEEINDMAPVAQLSEDTK